MPELTFANLMGQNKEVMADQMEENGFFVQATMLRGKPLPKDIGEQAVDMYRTAAIKLYSGKTSYGRYSNRIMRFALGDDLCDSTFRIEFRMNQSKPCMVIVFESMYESDFESYDDATPFVHMAMSVASEAFGTTNINTSDALNCLGSGCETCGHGGKWEQSIYVYDFKV